MKIDKLAVILSIVIIFIVFNSLTYNAFVFVKNFKTSKPVVCSTIYNEVGERNIVIRIDDIQDYAWFNSQKSIIDAVSERDFTTVLGIIPSRFGEDIRIFNLVERKKCEFEIALHGYDHEFKEFSRFSFEQSIKETKNGLQILNSIEPNIVTFIPPDNSISEEAKKGVYEAGVRIISSYYPGTKYGFTASTYDWETKNVERYYNVLDDCRESLDLRGLCVIMVHPQDFVDVNGKFDKNKFLQFEKVLDGIDELDANVINFRDLFMKDRVVIGKSSTGN